jgi:superfamily I DNA/RNA helicase
VAARYLDDGGSGPVGHGALRWGRDHPVVAGDQVPAWLDPPAGFGDGAAEGTDSPRQDERSDAFARAQIDLDVDELLQADEDGMFAQLRQPGIRDALAGPGSAQNTDAGGLTSHFAHIAIDEAQELTDAEWQMLLVRCPSHSFTIVGDRAQARRGFTETWQERLHRVGLDRVEIASLNVNYRTPTEVMTEAEPVIRSVLPDANVPTSIRTAGVPVRHGSAAQLSSIIEDWIEAHHDGIACVVGAPGFATQARVSSLTPETVKGLEFDLVVIVDPDSFGTGIEGAVDRYVAMTRATQQLVILTRGSVHRWTLSRPPSSTS